MGEARPRQRKFAPRSRQGCLTCRARRKRCDGQHPTCQNCERLNLTCEWQAQRRITLDREARQDSVLSQDATRDLVAPLRPALDVWDDLPIDEIAERKHLLQYYVTAFVPSVSVATTASSFYTNLYIPWAFSCDGNGILNAIIAMSSAQLARRSTVPERAQHLQKVSARHQQRCYAFLAERVPKRGGLPRDAHQVIGIILLLVGLEALSGKTNTKWLSQMKCVRDILNMISRRVHPAESWELDSLQRHFTYHNAMASLMARVSKREDHNPSDTVLALLHTTDDALTVDPLMGIAYRLCQLIARIQHVTSSDPAYPQICNADFTTIEIDIQSWSYGSPLGFPGLDTPIALDLIALAESYRLAALIQLYRHSPFHRSLIPSCASKAMEYISRIPPGSPAESSLLYPIFLAGAELSSEPEIASCLKRLNEIQARNRYENVGNVQKVLEEVWKGALSGGAKRDWEEVLKEWEWSFTLG